MLSRSFALVCLSASGLFAQTITYEPQSEGPLVGLPHAMSVAPGTEDATGLVDETLLKVRGVGFAPAPPFEAPPFSSVDPDYRVSAILQGISPLPDVDAFSAGLDWVLTDGDGVAVVPPGNWTAMSFSVTPATMGDPGTVIRAESMRADGAAGDLFGYVYEGSALPPPLVDVSLRSQDSGEIQIGSAAAPLPDVDAHDLFVDLVWRLNPQIVPFLPVSVQTPRAFFSVSSATTSLIPSGWWAGTTPSGATVFCSEWIGSAWTEPRPLVVPSDLGLGIAEEVDAVAVDYFRNEMLFSTKTAGDPPVLWTTGFAHPSAQKFGIIGLTVRPFRKPSNEPLPKGLGELTVDDVDAICTLDPGGSFLDVILGTPDQAALPLTNTEVSVSLYSVFDQVSGTVTYHSYGVGWPFPGRGPGVIAGFVAPINPINYVPIMPVLPNFNRNPLTPLGGDPHEIQLPLPPGVSGLGLPVYFYWLCADGGFQQFGQSWPVRIFL